MLKLLSLYKSALILSALCTVMMSVVLGELSSYHQQHEQFYQQLKHQNSTPPSIAGLPSYSTGIKDESSYSAITESPLFIEGRQAVVADIQAAPVEAQTLKLTGILISPQGYLALIQDDRLSSYRLKKGEQISGWQVDDIQATRVILRKNNQIKELSLTIESHPELPSASPEEQSGTLLNEIPPEEMIFDRQIPPQLTQ